MTTYRDFFPVRFPAGAVHARRSTWVTRCGLKLSRKIPRVMEPVTCKNCLRGVPSW